jgi:hypothetical protein
MNSVLFHAADKLARALRQVNLAHRDLSQVKRYAKQHDILTLEHGTSDLIQCVARLSTDLETLLGVVRARAENDRGSEIPAS